MNLPISRRELLTRSGGSFGAAALAWWLGQASNAAPSADLNGGLHHRAKAKRVIQLFMNGGASPMDTFDYKPELVRLHGQKLGPKEKPEGFTAAAGAVMKSPFEFKQHGETGRWVSSVFPQALGYLLVAAGAVYFTGSTLRFMAPHLLSSFEPAYVVCLIAELGFALWLLVRGVNIDRWRDANGPANSQ